MIERPLKMTKLCERCQYQYGLWRHHCPGCGLVNKQQAEAVAAPVPQRRANPFRDAKARVKQRARTGCIFCHAPGAKHTCPHCAEPIHRNCRGQHEDACAQFQVERKAAEEKLHGHDKASVAQRT